MFRTFFLLYFGKNLVRVERVDTGGPPGRFDICLGVGFALGQFVEVPEESLADTGASGAGVGGDCHKQTTMGRIMRHREAVINALSALDRT